MISAGFKRARQNSRRSTELKNLLSFSLGLISAMTSLCPARAQGLPSAHMGKYTRQKDSNDYLQFDSSAKSSTASRAGKTYSASKGKPDPLSGVELLETIISRVMNIPQVALTKSTGSQMLAQNIKQSNLLAQGGQGVDYKLAIRPKETGKVFAAPSPSLQIAQAARTSGYMPAQAGAPMAAPSNSPSYSGSSSGLGYGYPLKASRAVEPPSSSADSFVMDESAGNTAPNFESWKGNALAKLALKSDSNSYMQEKPGVWDRDGSARGNMAPAPTATPQSSFGSFQRQPGDNMAYQNDSEYAKRKQVPSLSTSVNRLYKLSRQIEEAQNYSDKAQEQIAAGKIKANEARTQVASARARSSYKNRQALIMDEAPVVKDYREDAGAGAPAGAGGAYLDNRAEPEPMDSLASNYAGRRMKAGSGATSGILANRLKDADAEKKSARKAEESGHTAQDKIALLPPNVVTGIPLGNVTLGKSESVVLSSLSRIGKMKEQKIRNWTVYSWTKKDGNGSDALQLFFRHGMLDAIRIFDASLIGADFGVAPGDHLEAVKERFGEPSFLLPEPGQELGKNYIYPISQVGFQLARQQGESSPKVLSVLIFSVK